MRFRRQPRLLQALAAGALTVALTGCSGGAIHFAPSTSQPPTPGATPTVAVPVPQPAAAAASDPAVDLDAYARYMMDLVNEARRAARLQPVGWDEIAAETARGHAMRMATEGYLSHWDSEGRGPAYRYWLAGGRDAVRENVYSYYQRYASGEPAPIVDWQTTLQRAHETLMKSKLHRENILQPSHTHLGIGIGYDPLQGELRIVQEFVDRYVAVEPIPGEVKAGDTITLAGEMLPGVTSPLINLAYEPFPEPMTREQLNQTGTFASRAEVYQALSPRTEGTHFEAAVHFDRADKPGLYHVRTWVTHSGESILASELFVTLR